LAVRRCLTARVVVGHNDAHDEQCNPWKNAELAIPAFLTIVVMPFAYSISAGIGAGFVSFVIIRITMGKIKHIHPLMWVSALMLIAHFVRGPLGDARNAF
jgi:adenine/guanine/hypoxanthine permease